MKNNSNKTNELGLSRLGLGCMRMSIGQSPNRNESIATIHAALDDGINLIDTGDFYGDDGHNEKLIGEALKGYARDKAFISVKYGTFSNLATGGKIDVGPKNVKEYVTNSLKRLNVDYIDLYQPARVDIGIPLEETIGAISKLVDAGYVRHIGLSEVDADTLIKANNIHPISLVELEYSITNSSIENEILPTARELGINTVAFGALGLGKLFKNEQDPLTDMINELAIEKNITLSQFAHAWILAKGEDIIPLVGVRTISQLEDSIQCLNVTFSENDILRIENSMKDSKILGPGMPKFVIKNGVVVR